MNLCIVINKSYVENEFSCSEEISIAGKTIIQYWAEWARYKEYERIYIINSNITVEAYIKESLEDLFNLEIIYVKGVEGINMTETKKHIGMGIFLDDGSYKTFENLNELFLFEKEIINKPLLYCSPVGYRQNEDIQIGKNVYIHKSVILTGKVIIGDYCIIEKNCRIHNSVINTHCLIKQNSIIEYSHVDQNLHFDDTIYLKSKALFAHHIYDKQSKMQVSHRGVCSIELNKES